MARLSEIKYENPIIDSNREMVYNRFIYKSSNVKSGIITKISVYDLQLLFQLYDEIFFKEYFQKNFKGKLNFSLSTKMTSSAGKTIFPRNLINLREDEVIIEIRMGINFFFRYYDISDDKMVNGIKTRNSLEAFQMVFEHEIGHLIELIDFKNTNCKKDRFKQIVKNIFGHKDVYHKLPTNKEIANVKYGFKVGDKVSFVAGNIKNIGIINNINKRATVMVRDYEGAYIDNKGNKYTKYYVPLGSLSLK